MVDLELLVRAIYSTGEELERCLHLSALYRQSLVEGLTHEEAIDQGYRPGQAYIPGDNHSLEKDGDTYREMHKPQKGDVVIIMRTREDAPFMSRVGVLLSVEEKPFDDDPEFSESDRGECGRGPNWKPVVWTIEQLDGQQKRWGDVEVLKLPSFRYEDYR